MKLKKALALALAMVMCLSLLAGCGGGTDAPADEEVNTTPLVVGYAPFNSKFSPFFSETAYDQDAMSLTQVALLGTDRKGATKVRPSLTMAPTIPIPVSLTA